MSAIKAIVIMGPTASGKSTLAMKLAKALKGEIISVDSALVYQGMDIGTAKPTIKEREQIPHHLIDLLDPKEAYSTGRFLTDANACIESIANRQSLPILAGGTMLYFNALLKGLSSLPAADPDIRAALDQALREKGLESLHAELQGIDPISAQRIHPNDPQRILRALEVFMISGIPLSEHFLKSAPKSTSYDIIPLILMPSNRERLHQRIQERFIEMIKEGFIEEVKALKARSDLTPEHPSMRAVGYRQIWDYLEDQYDYSTMLERGVIATRQFAKRQITWLRKEQDVPIFDSEGSKLFDEVMTYLSQSLLDEVRL